MKCVVHHEAGAEFVNFGKELAAVTAKVAPLVEQVTELTLPDTLVIRLMTVPDWTQAHRRKSERLLTRELEEFRPSSDERAQAAQKLKRHLQFRDIFWPTMLGEAEAFEPGCPELVIVPESLRQAGRLDDGPSLYKICSHEMTHLAQYKASGGAVWTVPETFFPHRRGIQGRDFASLVEGHAYWADQQITSQLFGAPVSTDEPAPYASPRYRELHASPLRMAGVERQRLATATVAQLIRQEGLLFFNRVWTDFSLVPMATDTTPDLWRQRFQPR
ncbi:hypothetical protein [Streptomyces olivaceus]|uniref:hypothetical protein n=1 Tax=Streptomyces olivaceus TaxID=47716 RepID=UPI0018850FCF|nr:hypothetical protein [Streptomyces olivaceus]